ncbi:MAG: hypothetical protein K6E20_03305 [Acholeplasmatales bacterium]|nr:hypothetical protein [Acholeplasmatales bacterium]
MPNFLKSKAKLLILIYGVIIALVLLFALAFMTNYADVHVFYRYGTDKQAIFNSSSVLNINGQTNSELFTYFSKLASSGGADANNPLYELLEGKSGSTVFVDSGLAQIVYNFQTDMSDFNQQLIIYFVVSIILFSVMLICSNQSRKVYYISNLVVGITVPLLITVYSVVMLVKNLNLMNRFLDNQDLFKAVAYLQNGKIEAIDKNNAINDWNIILDHTEKVNVTPFIFGIIVIILVIVYSIFMAIYTLYRFKESSKRRAEIIERAANNND